MPALVGGFGNLILPLVLSAPDIRYPRINSFRVWVFGGRVVFILLTMFIGTGVGVSWVLYPPLSRRGTPEISVDSLIFSLHISGLRSLVGRLNFAVTTVNIQSHVISVETMRLFRWAISVTVFLLLLSLPVLAGALTMLLFDRNFGTSFFSREGGGNPLLYQHRFWFFGHPEVYVLIAPAFGVVRVRTLYISGKKEVFGVLSIVYALLSIAFVGSVVWAHHIYIVGIDLDTRAYFTRATIIIAIPTGVKVFRWILTLYGVKLILTPLLSWVLGFVALFTIGGLRGVILASSALDVILHDSYYVIAHFHFVLRLGRVFGIFLGITLWWNYFTGLSINITLMSIFFVSLFTGVNVTFFPLHFAGLQGGSRKYAQVHDTVLVYHKIATFGSQISLIGIMVFLLTIYETFKAFRLVFKPLISKSTRERRSSLMEHNGQRTLLFRCMAYATSPEGRPKREAYKYVSQWRMARLKYAIADTEETLWAGGDGRTICEKIPGSTEWRFRYRPEFRAQVERDHYWLWHEDREAAEELNTFWKGMFEKGKLWDLDAILEKYTGGKYLD